MRWIAVVVVVLVSAIAACGTAAVAPRDAGGCSPACGDGAACVQGLCVLLERSGADAGPEAQAGPDAALEAGPDARPCGAQGFVGDSGQCECVSIASTWCDGYCVRLMQDVRNCGACGHQCGEHESCDQGVCKCPNDRYFELCGTECVSVQQNPNCGRCGHACQSPDRCIPNASGGGAACG